MIKRDDPTPRPSGATTAADVTAVAQLVLHERHARDRAWWNDMRRSFAEDSGVRLSWFQGTGPDFVSASDRMAERGDASVHRLAPPVVDVNGDRALDVVPAGIEVRTDLDGVEVDLVSCPRLCTGRNAGPTAGGPSPWAPSTNATRSAPACPARPSW
ncbi:nuclear transport factor 2 family protein [Streptomyces sp. CA-100214]